jgi:hypothetical protein
MAEVGMSPAELTSRAETLRKAGSNIADWTNRVRVELDSHDPGKGGQDYASEAIDSKYFDAANLILQASEGAAKVITDLADMTISVADKGAVTEADLKKLNDDYAFYKQVPSSILDSLNEMAQKPNDITGTSSHGKH